MWNADKKVLIKECGISCLNGIPFLHCLENNETLFPNGPNSIDFQPDTEIGCPNGYEQHTLRPDRYCKDKFFLTENSTLVLYDKRKYQNYSYPLNQFCIALNGNAKTKDDHFATICITDSKHNSRMA